jgi:hypothetical protein
VRWIWAALALFATSAFAADFSAGETLDFTLEFLSIDAGHARMTIAPQSDDSSHYWITSVAESTSGFSHVYRVRDELESIVKRRDFSTTMYRKKLSEGNKLKDETTTVANGQATRNGKQVAVREPVFDPLSILFYFRTLPLAVGKKFDVPVIADGKLYTLGVEVTATQRITTPLGTFDALVVEPKSEMAGGVFRDEKNRMTIWYSADERHLPLRIKSELKFGSITATLNKVAPNSVNSSK